MNMDVLEFYLIFKGKPLSLPLSVDDLELIIENIDGVAYYF